MLKFSIYLSSSCPGDHKNPDSEKKRVFGQNPWHPIERLMRHLSQEQSDGLTHKTSPKFIYSGCKKASWLSIHRVLPAIRSGVKIKMLIFSLWGIIWTLLMLPFTFTNSRLLQEVPKEKKKLWLSIVWGLIICQILHIRCFGWDSTTFLISRS